MKRKILVLLIVCLATLPVLALQQATGVTAEAVGQANLRAITDINAELLGQIQAGTQYPVIGRSEFYPWVLLGDPVTLQPIGWVYSELVTIRGDVNQVPFSSMEVSPGQLAITTAAPTPSDSADAAVSPTATEIALYGVAIEVPTSTPSYQVTGTVMGEINVRYGPGVEYPRIGIGHEGERYEILSWHTQLPWVKIRYPAAPNGEGWVATDLLQIEGDLYSLPSTTQLRFTNLPTLTPTLPVVQSAELIRGTPVPLSPEFQALGSQLWDMVLTAGFDPQTSRLGTLFLMDLQTGEAISFESGIAFSGMSLNKISILAEFFRQLNDLPDDTEAINIVEALTCSENISTNRLLSDIGDGSPFAGAQRVTDFLQDFGLQNTFINAPYGNDPFITPEPVRAPVTEADQLSAQPDPYNQATVDELGFLLSSIYQCAYRDSSPLLETFPDEFTPNECRQMINVMSHNHINNLIESGVPLDTRVAHKHGWVDDTHGDAGIVFTPGGDYVLVMIVHNPTWLDYSDSFPLMSEISRTVYNYYNPEAPLEEIHSDAIPEGCDLLNNPLLDDLLSGTVEN